MLYRAFLGRFSRTAALGLMLSLAACTLTTGGDSSSQNISVSGAPVVQIISPLPNATYLVGVLVPIQASISNAGPDISRVEVAVDGGVIATYPSPNPSGGAVFTVTGEPWPITEVGTHSITVTAFRGDGSSAPQSVNINIVEAQTRPTSTPTTQAQVQPTTDSGGGSTQPTAQTQPTQNTQAQPTTAPTNAPPPTNPPPSPTSDKPMAKILVGVNVRSGPSTVFNPPIGSLAANSEAEVLGVSPDGTWYKIRYYNGEGWVYGPNVSVSGNTASIPVDAGPPTPVPTAIPPTPLPTNTSPPPSNVNFVITSATISPHPFVCAQDSKITVVVTNNGTAASSDGGEILVQDQLTSNGAVTETTKGAFPPLQPGQSFTSEMFLRVNTNYAVEHRTVITIDSTNKVGETNENDNQNVSVFVLQKGNCP